MFKKISTAIVVMSPLLFLFVGYPVSKNVQVSHKKLAVSERCFQIGNMQQFFSCFSDHKRLSGGTLIENVIAEVNDLQPGMGYGFILCILGQLVLISFLIGDKK